MPPLIKVTHTDELVESKKFPYAQFPFEKFNCFGVDTKFITKEGLKSFRDFKDGDNVFVLNRYGGFKKATVSNFGPQNIVELTVFKAGSNRTKVIRTTEDHIWFVRKSKGNKESSGIKIIEKYTKDLKKGDLLHQVFRHEKKPPILCPIGVMHGLVFGDGTYSKHYGDCRIALCEDSRQFKELFFAGRSIELEKYNQTLIYDLPSDWKKIPKQTNIHYLSGFLAGWFAADGSLGGNPILGSTNKKALDWMHDYVCPILGLDVSDVYLVKNDNAGSFKFNNDFFAIRFYQHTFNPKYLLKNSHIEKYKKSDYKVFWQVHSVKRTDDYEDVWCVNEPQSNSFVLDGGVVTHNCIQSTVFEYYNLDNNLVIASSTSSGKTCIAELMLSHEIREKGNKGMYLVPMRALAQEKYDEWTDSAHHFSDLNISICTGDYKLTADRRAELEKADLIIMSSEMLSHRCRNASSEKSQFLFDTKCLVVDECFPGSTKIKLNKNVEASMKKIYEDDSINEVLSYDDSTGKFVVKNIARKIRKKATNNLVSVNHEYGQFVCTEDHKIWTDCGFVKAKDLTENHLLKWIPEEKKLYCEECDRHFKKHKDYVAHYFYGHLNKGGNTNHIDKLKKCDKCNEFFSVYGYQSHLKNCGIIKKNEYIPKTKICKICKKEFTTASSRAKHELHHYRTKESYQKAVETRNNNPDYYEAMKKMGRKRRGKDNPIYRNPESLEKLKELGTERWKNLSEDEKIEQVQRFINAPLNKTSGTKIELLLEEFVEGMPIRRTSGGKFWLTFKNGKRKNPDFKVNGKRKVIEVGDIEYWHTEEEIKEVIGEYNKIGYQCLYLTNVDIEKGKDHVLEVVNSFLDNHSSKVLSVKKWGRDIDYVYDLEVEDNHNYFAEGVLVSNCHLLTVAGRGDHLESGLMKFTEMNPDARLLLLSATMPNVEEIAEWVSYVLTKKDTVMLRSDYRPCPLYLHYERYYDSPSNSYEANEMEKVQAALDIIEYYPNDKFLVFVHTKRTGQLMKKQLEMAGISCEYHNADLTKEKRINLERKFKEKDDPRVVVATSTLAWGCNLPARRVIILGVHRGMSEVATYDIFQEVGRAGRPRYDPVGDAYILLPQTRFDQYREKLKKPQPIVSQMLEDVGGHHKTLAFHLVSEINNGSVQDKDDVHHWYKRSLACFQSYDLDAVVVDKVLDLLKKCGAVWEEDGKLTATAVGKIASLFYYSPFDVADLKKNFNYLFTYNVDHSDVMLSIALGNIDTQRLNIVSRAEREAMQHYLKKLNDMLPPDYYLNDAAVKAGYAYYMLLNGLHNEWFGGFMRGLQYDFPRLNQVLMALDGFTGKWGRIDWFNTLQTRIVYGVKGDLIKLVQLPDVGKVRAEKLWKAGIRSLEDVIGASERIGKLLRFKEDKVKAIVDKARAMLLVGI